MTSMTISDNQRKSWRGRLDNLLAHRVENDYQIASLLYEVRQVFPKGGAGDQTFMLFVKQHLRPLRTDTALAKAIACESFDHEDWNRLGGWQSISLLCTMNKQQRKHVLSLLHGPGPFNYPTILKRAKQVGITPRRPGRPSEETQTARNNVLRNFLQQLYRQRHDLPPLPPEVRAALSPRTLAAIESIHHLAQA